MELIDIAEALAKAERAVLNEKEQLEYAEQEQSDANATVWNRSQRLKAAETKRDEIVAEMRRLLSPAALEPAPQTDPEGDAVQIPEGGWTLWRGGECPVPLGTPVTVAHADGGVYNATAGEGCATRWEQTGRESDIIAYRIGQPAQEAPTAASDASQPDQPAQTEETHTDSVQGAGYDEESFGVTFVDSALQPFEADFRAGVSSFQAGEPDVGGVGSSSDAAITFQMGYEAARATNAPGDALSDLPHSTGPDSDGAIFHAMSHPLEAARENGFASIEMDEHLSGEV